MASSSVCKLYTIELSKLGSGEIPFETEFKNILKNCIESIIANNIDVVTKTDWKEGQNDFVKFTGFISDVIEVENNIHAILEKSLSPKGQFKILQPSGEIVECWLGYNISSQEISLFMGRENHDRFLALPLNYKIGHNVNEAGILEPVIEEIVDQIYNLSTIHHEVFTNAVDNNSSSESEHDTEEMSEDTSDDDERGMIGYNAQLYKLPKLRW